MRQLFAWAIIDSNDDQLALWNSRCPIYWRRDVALKERNDRNRAAKDDDAYYVIKVTILPVNR